jgi:hypothetical protein
MQWRGESKKAQGILALVREQAVTSRHKNPLNG